MFVSGVSSVGRGSSSVARSSGVGSTGYVSKHTEGAVPPVDPIRSVRGGQYSSTGEPFVAQFELPVIREGADPVEMSVRSRIVPYEESGVGEESGRFGDQSVFEKILGEYVDEIA